MYYKQSFMGGASFRRAAAAVLAATTMIGCAPTTTGTQERLARGEQLYEANCARCHGGATGGDIADIPPRHNAEGHTWHHADCDLIRIVREGMPRRPGLPDDAPTMPAFGDRLEDADIRAILAHIKSWWDEDQQKFQQQVTDQACE